MGILLGAILSVIGIGTIWGGASGRMAAMLAAFFAPKDLGPSGTLPAPTQDNAPLKTAPPPASPQPGVPVPGVPGQTEGSRPTSSGPGATQTSPGSPVVTFPSTPPVVY